MPKRIERKGTINLKDKPPVLWGLPRSVVSFVIISITSVIVFRIATLDGSKLEFDFSALLSLLLAFFAISLSALFYFKAEETSNQFYDNSYKFTKEVSEMLGRIESGFGERLLHMDKGVTELRDQVGRLPFDTAEARLKEKEDTKDVERKEAELLNVLEDLAKRAALADNEKKEVFAKLESNQKELMAAKIELQRQQNRIHEAELLEGIHPHVIDEVKGLIREFFPAKGKPTNNSFINNRFRHVMGKMDSGISSYMRRQGLVDENLELTEKGIELVRYLWRDCESIARSEKESLGDLY